MSTTASKITVPLMADLVAKGETPDVLFWVGCAGSFDQRAQKVTKAFVKILHHVGVKFAILGPEEICTGDPARRAGNEFLFQMQAITNIETLNMYGVKSFLQALIDDGKLRIKDGGTFKGRRITFHDSCYLGRANGIYEAPRKVLETLDAELVEMKRCKSRGLCCGAGGAQMFKEEEAGKKRVNQERTLDMLDSKANIVAAACPFCMTMLTDGIKEQEKQESVQVLDIAELIAQAEDLV